MTATVRVCPRCSVGTVAPRCRICDACAGYTDAAGLPVLRVVADEYCPACGREGSPKVTDEEGTQWWKCLSSRWDCAVGYWVPGDDRVEMKPSEEEAARMDAEVKERVDRMMVGKTWGLVHSANGVEQWQLVDAEPGQRTL